MPIDDANERDDAAVRVEVRVEDERLERRLRVALGRRNATDHRLERVAHALARLAAGENGLLGGDRESLLDLVSRPLGIGGRKIDLVDDRDDLEVRVHRHERVGDGLRLHALRRVDDEQHAFARRERTADLVGEVDVTRGVDEVQLVGLPVVGVVEQPDRLRLDRDAALALDVHRVEHLLHHVARPRWYA